MARQGHAAAAGQQAEHVFQARRDFTRFQHAQPRRREFGGERHAVQPAADRGHRRRVRIGQRVAAERVRGAFGEQPHRIALHGRGSGKNAK
jgi:hypothetical protein